jgi:hypothetical protein
MAVVVVVVVVVLLLLVMVVLVLLLMLTMKDATRLPPRNTITRRILTPPYGYEAVVTIHRACRESSACRHVHHIMKTKTAE